MKKLLLIAGCMGAFMGSSTHVRGMNIATPGTQILGAAAVGTVGVGLVGWLIGHYGATNTIGLGIAGLAGGVVGYATDSALKGLAAIKLCPAFLTANPMVAPLVLGSAVGGLLFWLRKQYLSSHSKELEEYGTVLLKAGIALGALTTVSYAANIGGYSLCLPFEPLAPQSPQV